MSSALTYEMIYEQPVCHEFSHVEAKTVLVIGQADRTVVGKARVKKELLAKVGQYPEVGRNTATLIPGARLVEPTEPPCGWTAVSSRPVSRNGPARKERVIAGEDEKAKCRPSWGWTAP